MKHIAVHIAAHGRHETAEIAYTALDRVLAQFQEHGYTSTVYVAVSDAETRRLAENHGYNTLTVPNKPLGKKFDDLLKHITQTDPNWSWLLEYGSDNVLDVEYVPDAVAAIEAGHSHICLNAFFITPRDNHAETRLFYKPRATSNIGRLTHRRHIEATYAKHGYVYEHRLKQHIDGDSHARVRRAGRVSTFYLERNPPYLVDLKDAGSLHTYDGFARKPNKFPAVPLSGNFPEIQPTNTWQLQAKSGATQSASTSATQPFPTPEQPQPAAPSETTRTKTTRTNSSPAQPAAPSQAAAKQSTRRRKTTTGAGKSSRAVRRGPSARKGSSSTD